jgi:hypothetical protein
MTLGAWRLLAAVAVAVAVVALTGAEGSTRTVVVVATVVVLLSIAIGLIAIPSAESGAHRGANGPGACASPVHVHDDDPSR